MIRGRRAGRVRRGRQRRRAPVGTARRRREPEDLPSQRGERGFSQQIPTRPPLPAMLGTVVLDGQSGVRVGEVEVEAAASGNHRVLDHRGRQPAEVQGHADAGLHRRRSQRVHQCQHLGYEAAELRSEVPIADAPDCINLDIAVECQRVDGRDPLRERRCPAGEVEGDALRCGDESRTPPCAFVRPPSLAVHGQPVASVGGRQKDVDRCVPGSTRSTDEFGRGVSGHHSPSAHEHPGRACAQCEVGFERRGRVRRRETSAGTGHCVAGRE